MASELNPTTTTADGLVLKNQGLIEDIITRTEIRVEAAFVSWQCSRIVRRDFNLVTRKMFIRARDKVGRQQVMGFMEELQLQAGSLKDESLKYELESVSAPTVFPLRLVTPEATMLYKSLLVMDAAIARFYSAYMNGHIGKNQYEDSPIKAITAYNSLKSYVMSTSVNRTASEIGKERGIT